MQRKQPSPPVESLDSLRSVARRSILLALVLSFTGCMQLPKLPPLPTPANRRAQEKQRMDMARLAENHAKLAEARQVYNKILERNPKQREAWHRLAVVASREAKWDEAEDHYRRVLELGAPNAQILGDMGYTLYLQHRLPEAEKVLRDALAQEPRHRSASNNLALVLGQQGRFDECLAMFRNVNDEAEAESNLAYVLTQMGQPKLAQVHFSRALSLNPEMKKSAQALLQLARAEGGGQPVAPVVDQRLIAGNNTAGNYNNPVNNGQPGFVPTAAPASMPPNAAVFGAYQGTPMTSANVQPATMNMPNNVPAQTSPMYSPTNVLPAGYLPQAGVAPQQAVPIPATPNMPGAPPAQNAPAFYNTQRPAGTQAPYATTAYQGQQPAAIYPGAGSPPTNMQPNNMVQPFNVVPAGGGAAGATNGIPYGSQPGATTSQLPPGFPAPFVR
ncbi:MAG: tetratricopeptide repeat protein [Planctomycetes bacterium]|nr:tetratricopeptide repeat protein [Planctomycetota bacterium]